MGHPPARTTGTCTEARAEGCGESRRQPDDGGRIWGGGLARDHGMAEEPAVGRHVMRDWRERRARLPGLRITYDLAFDRIVHNAVRIQMGDVNMRERTMGKRPEAGVVAIA